MINEGLYILAVSLSGSFSDFEYVSNFNNCDDAMAYYHEKCADYKAASCTLSEYTQLPKDHLEINVFDYAIKEQQSCGFIGIDTRAFQKGKR